MKNVICVSLVNCAVFAVALWAGFAFADGAVALPTTDDQALGLATTLWQFMVEKKYAAMAGPGLTLAVWALKKWDTKIPKVGPVIDKFLDKPMVSFALPTVIAAVGGFVTSLATGHSFTDALGAVYAASSSAITTYIGLRKLEEQLSAGKAAAAEVQTKTDAVNELNKP